MKNPKSKVGIAGIIAVVGTMTFYVFTPDQVDLKSHDVQALIIHCSATREGQKNITPKVVTDWHMAPKPKGYGERIPPYNVIVGYDQTVWYRPWNKDNVVDRVEVAWGAGNYNICSYHICVIGGMNKQYTKEKNTLTVYQDSVLWEVVKTFKEQYPYGFVIGHNQIAKKACPSFSIPKWIKYHAKEHEKYTPSEFNL
jgi:N-acetylmuramoyl-L-alanine amidase